MAAVALPIAMGIGSMIAGMYAAEEQSQAQQGANVINLQIERERQAEQARQFDIAKDIQEQQFGYQSGQLESRYGYEQQRADELARSRIGRFDVMRGENIARLDPYSQAGQAASAERSALMGLSGAEAQKAAFGRFTESPGQKRFREIQEKALLRSQAKIGGLGGGNVRTALQEQAFDIAQQDYDRQLARLSGVAGEGLQAGQLAIAAGYGPDVGVGETAYSPYQAYSPVESKEFTQRTDVPIIDKPGGRLPPKEAWYDPQATGEYISDLTGGQIDPYGTAELPFGTAVNFPTGTVTTPAGGAHLPSGTLWGPTGAPPTSSGDVEELAEEATGMGLIPNPTGASGDDYNVLDPRTW